MFSHRIEDGRVTSYAPSPTYLTSPQHWLPRWIMPIGIEDSVDDDTLDAGSCTVHSSGSKGLKVVENVSARWNDVNCFNTMKVLENDAEEQKVVEKGSVQVNSTSASLCDLSPELLEMVVERVSSFIEYTYFLNINKLGSDVARRRKNTFRSCLIYQDMMKSFYSIIDSNISRKIHVEIPQQVRGKRIGCCRDCWLLVSVGNLCCLLNPLTRQVIETVGYKCKNGGYGISNLTFIGGKPSPYSPAKTSVLAMSLVYARQGLVLEPGDATDEGRAMCWKLLVEKFQASCNSPILLGEDWYHLGYGKSSGRLGRLQLKEGEFEWEVEWEVEKLKCPCEYYTRTFLTELVSVFIGDEGESWVRVFKICEDSIRRKWIPWEATVCILDGLVSWMDIIYFLRRRNTGHG